MAETFSKSAPSISLRANNPYSIGRVFTFDDGHSALDRAPFVYFARPIDRYYRITDGDTLQDIAFAAYGDSKYWWVIADGNLLINPFELERGMELIIPDLEILKTTTYAG